MSDGDEKKDQEKGEHLDKVTVNIISPRGSRDFTFGVTTKVQVVIDDARVAFGFAPGTFALRRESTGETLAPERTLESYHLKSNETLKLAPEQGSGV